MNEACYVVINGETWYLPCDRVNDIGLSKSNDLIVLNSSSLTLYRDFSLDNTNLYPRISCQFGRVCTLQHSNQNSSLLTDVSLDIGYRSIVDPFFLNISICVIAMGVILWNLLKH